MAEIDCCELFDELAEADAILSLATNDPNADQEAIDAAWEAYDNEYIRIFTEKNGHPPGPRPRRFK